MTLNHKTNECLGRERTPPTTMSLPLYDESVQTPQALPETVGRFVGNQFGESINTSVMPMRKDGDILQQMGDYYTSMVERRLKGDPKVKVHPFRTHAVAVADFGKYATQRAQVQLEVSAKIHNDHPDRFGGNDNGIIAIPKLYSVREKFTEAHKEALVTLLDSLPLGKWARAKGYELFGTSYRSPSNPYVMYMVIFVPHAMCDRMNIPTA